MNQAMPPTGANTKMTAAQMYLRSWSAMPSGQMSNTTSPSTAALVNPALAPKELVSMTVMAKIVRDHGPHFGIPTSWPIRR